MFPFHLLELYHLSPKIFNQRLSSRRIIKTFVIFLLFVCDFYKKEDVPPVITINNQRHIFLSTSLFLLFQQHLIHIPLPDPAVLRHKLHRFLLLDSL